jgi:hypothetical protein
LGAAGRLNDVEAKPTIALGCSGLAAAPDPDVLPAVDPARVLPGPRDAGTGAGGFLLRVVSGRYADFTLIPPWLVFAFDHAMFIGVMTNGLIGLGMLLSGDREQVWSWADDLAYWGINAGLIGFVIGLMVQSAALKRVSAPVMGASIVVALLALWMRLQRTHAPAPRPMT